MFKNLLNTFLHKAVYGLFANIALALSAGAHIAPEGDEVGTYLWRTLGVAAFTGLAGVVNRLRNWDPTKASN
jgi:hypothetical protein